MNVDYRRGWGGTPIKPPNLPVLNGIYTIRDFVPADVYGPEQIRLVEIRNPSGGRWEYEPSFAPKRFRPAVERKTDISIFTEMLTKTGVDA